MRFKDLFKVSTIFLMVFFCFGLFALAECYAQDCQKAEMLFKQALNMKHSPGDVETLMEKEQLYRKAVRLCPGYAQAHNNLGDVCEKLGKYTEAIEEYEKTISIQSDASTPYFGLGDIYFKNGDYKKAIGWYDEGLKLDPNDTLSKQLRSQAKLLLKGKSWVIPKEQIVQILDPMQTRGPGDPIKMSFNSDNHIGSVPFDTDRYDIREDAKAQLKELGEALSDPRLSQYKFRICGHTDIRGTEAHNKWLSNQRAKAVKECLVENFRVPNDRLSVIGYGESRIIVSGTDETAHAVNRRVEIERLGLAGETSKVNAMEPPGNAAISMDVGFLYKDGRTGRRLQIGRDGMTVLRTSKDPYQIFFRPYQPCYVYLLQKDSAGKWYLLFPKRDSDIKINPVRTGKDYWIPGFDKGFTLDETRGEEKIYFLASLWEISDLESQGSRLEEEVVIPITRSFQTRGSYVGKPQNRPGPGVPVDCDGIIKTLEGAGCFSETISFQHQ